MAVKSRCKIRTAVSRHALSYKSFRYTRKIRFAGLIKFLMKYERATDISAQITNLNRVLMIPTVIFRLIYVSPDIHFYLPTKPVFRAT